MIGEPLPLTFGINATRHACTRLVARFREFEFVLAESAGIVRKCVREGRLIPPRQFNRLFEHMHLSKNGVCCYNHDLRGVFILFLDDHTAHVRTVIRPRLRPNVAHLFDFATANLA